MTDTRQKLIDAGEVLFASKGFAGTSIAALEKAAGLAPRTGGFYRHFESKEALAKAVAQERLIERREDFDLARFLPLPDLRSELLLIARTYLEAARRQRERQRLIEELRKIPALRKAEQQANAELLDQLCEWVAAKPAATGLGPTALVNLTMLAFAGILFLSTKIREGVELEALDPDSFVEHWVNHTATLLSRAS